MTATTFRDPPVNTGDGSKRLRSVLSAKCDARQHGVSSPVPQWALLPRPHFIFHELPTSPVRFLNCTSSFTALQYMLSSALIYWWASKEMLGKENEQEGGVLWDWFCRCRANGFFGPFPVLLCEPSFLSLPHLLLTSLKSLFYKALRALSAVRTNLASSDLVP